MKNKKHHLDYPYLSLPEIEEEKNNKENTKSDRL